MKNSHSTFGLRCLAAVAGVVFLSGTAVLIFGDVIKGAPLTEKHYIAAVIIAGTMLVGHLAHEAWRNSKYGSSFAFGFLFAIGTALVVLSSAGRQNETVSTTQAQAEAAEAARADARQGLKRAQAMLAEAQAALGRECKSGSGKRCAGIQRTIDVYEAAARGEQSKLDHIGPAKVVAPDEETFAEVVATIFGASKERVKATAVLAKPFLISLFLEFGAIVSFGFAFRGERRTISGATIAKEINTDASIDWNSLPSPSMFSGDLPEPPKPKKRKPLPATNVIEFKGKHPVIAALESAGGSVGSNLALARIQGISAGESSKRWQEVQHLLDVQRVGKELRIALKQTA